MKRLLLFFCAIFYACDVGTNNEPNNPSPNQAISLSSSSSVISSSSHENSSSSAQINTPLCSESILSEMSDLYFDEQGGIENIIIVGNIHGLLEGSGIEECEYFRADHSLYGNPTKIESDYCKSNYCGNVFSVSNSSRAPIMKKECSWYNVTLTSKNSLLISVNKNETGKERSEYIPFVMGGCALFDTGFTIIQSAGN